MENGTISVRTRAMEDLGAMRVDEFAEYLKKETPPTSQFDTKRYSKAWNPADYGLEPI